MQCEICGKAPAVITYTEHREDTVRTLRLCQKCAEERGLHISLTTKKFALAEPLAALAEALISDDKEGVGALCCRNCELPFSTFASTGRLGCAECYDSFAVQLKPLLRKAHGSTTHVGKAPAKDGPQVKKKKELRALQEALERAVKRERYEEAARIRDKIRELEAAGANGDEEAEEK